MNIEINKSETEILIKALKNLRSEEHEISLRTRGYKRENEKFFEELENLLKKIENLIE